MPEVLDLKRPLEPRREEAAEGGDEGCESCKDHSVDLHRRHGDAEVLVVRGQEEEVRKGVRVLKEDRVGFAVEAGEYVGTEVLVG